MTTDYPALAAELRRLMDAATGVGRWHWSGNTKTRQIDLSTWVKGCGRTTVMGFRRWGTQSAKPVLNTGMMLVDADQLAVYEVCPEAQSANDPRLYRHDIIGLRHPDAELIVAAVNALPDLLDHIDALTAERDALRAKVQAVEALADDPSEMAAALGGGASWLTTGTKVAAVMSDWLRAALKGQDA